MGMDLYRMILFKGPKNVPFLGFNRGMRTYMKKRVKKVRVFG